MVDHNPDRTQLSPARRRLLEKLSQSDYCPEDLGGQDRVLAACLRLGWVAYKATPRGVVAHITEAGAQRLAAYNYLAGRKRRPVHMPFVAPLPVGSSDVIDAILLALDEMNRAIATAGEHLKALRGLVTPSQNS